MCGTEDRSLELLDKYTHLVLGVEDVGLDIELNGRASWAVCNYLIEPTKLGLAWGNNN